VFVAVVLYVYFQSQGGGLKTRQVVALLLLFYGAFWLFGPWVVDRLGRTVGRFARRPATLLAARRLSDDPRGTWRTVSGLVLAGFAAGFFAVSMVGTDGSQFRGQVAVVTSSAAEARHATVEARTLLREAGVRARVGTVKENDFDSLTSGSPGLVAHVCGGPSQIDTAVTALAPLGTSRMHWAWQNGHAQGR
jgi:hypothetical protein